MPQTSLFLFSLTFILSLSARLVIDLGEPIYLLIIIFIILGIVAKNIFLSSSVKWRASLIFICLLILPGRLISWPQRPADLLIGKATIDVWLCQWTEPGWKNRQAVLCPLDSTDQGGKIISQLPLYPPFNYGDQLRVSCDLRLPESFADFDYPAYLARLHIFRQCAWPQIIDYQTASHGWAGWRLLFAFKNQLASLITSSLPEPEAGLVLAIILGYRQSLTPTLKENFRLAGLSHLTAVSGSHISILAALFLLIYLFLGGRRRFAWLPLSIILAIYVVLVGARPPAIRAFLMGISALVAWRLGRLPHPISILTATAALSLMVKPLALLDVAWQLSFGALLGIFIFFSYWQIFLSKILGQLPRSWRPYLRPPALSLGLSLSVQLLIWPITAWHFQTLALTTIVSNVLIFWAFGPVMTVLPLVLLATHLWPAGSLIFFSPVYQLAHYLVTVATFTAQLTSLAVDLKIDWPLLIIYYSLLAGGAYYFKKYHHQLLIKKINSEMS